MKEFEGKSVLITGGSSGIGKASAAAFLREGASVYILGRRKDMLLETLDELGKISSKINMFPCDVSVPKECRLAVESAAAASGRLDVLVNSAGVYLEGPSEDTNEDQWDRVVDTNLKGTFFMCRYAAPELEKTRGCIVNISSDSGITGNNKAAVYCASKGGVTLMTRALAVEWLSKGIRVNAVCPGIVETPMVEKDFLNSEYSSRVKYNSDCLRPYPPGTVRYTRPEEVAETILFLASSTRVEAINGACISIDFGLTAGY